MLTKKYILDENGQPKECDLMTYGGVPVAFQERLS